MDKTQVTKPGKYFYRRPSWDRPHKVTVEEPVKGCLVVRFFPDFHPEDLKSVPADAIFEEVAE